MSYDIGDNGSRLTYKYLEKHEYFYKYPNLSSNYFRMHIIVAISIAVGILL